jgi:pilus assembly protein CpaE
MAGKGPALTALSITADRELWKQFSAAVDRTRAFQVLAEFDAYPSEQALEVRLRQTRPDVILLDLASNLEVACNLIRSVISMNLQTHIVGLHIRNDSDAILRSLRTGASEFLHAPFDAEMQMEVVSRVRRLLDPNPTDEVQPGSIVAFASAKPGSGASTLASQTAFAIRRATSKRVLLADFDLMGGMIGFYLKLASSKSLLDAIQFADQLSDSVWPSFVSNFDGVDILAAPDTPYTGAIDAARLHALLEYTRMNYDWIIIDLPVVFQRLSLLAISESDRAFLISTAELPSLHLARKAVNLLEHLGFPKERFQIMMNRVNRRDEIAKADMDRLLNCGIDARVPNDYFSLHRAVTLGQPVDGHSELGKAIEGFAGRLSGGAKADRKNPAVGDWRAVPSTVS